MAVAGQSPSQSSCSMVAPEENQHSGICSTSGSTHVNDCLASSVVDSSKDRRRRRWKGRRPPLQAKDYVESLRGSSSDCSGTNKGADTNDTEASADTKMVLYPNVHSILLLFQ